MKVMFKKCFSFMTPILTGLVFLLFPSKAFAFWDSIKNAFKSAVDYVGGLFKKVVNWVLDFVFGSCPNPNTLLNRNLSDDGCWICKLFNKIFEAINLLATSVYNHIHMSVISLLAICLAFYILFRVGKAFLSFQPQDPMDFWNQMGKVFFKTIIACAFLVQPAGILGYWIVSPFIELAVSFNQVILESLMTSETYNQTPEEEKSITDAWAEELLQKVQEGGGTGVEYLEYISYSKGNSTSSFDTLASCTSLEMTEAEAAADGNLFNAQIRQSLECMIKGLYKEAAFAISVASYIICKSWRHMNDIAGFIPFPNFGALLAGLAMWATCFFVIVLFAFKIIDATVRLGILCTLLPILLVAWVFPPTVEYAKKGVHILVQVMLTYIITAVIMGLAIIIIMNAFSGEAAEFDLKSAFLDDKAEEIGNNIGIFTGTFFIGLFCCVLAFLVMGIIDKIATEYGNVQFGDNTTESIGGMLVKNTLMAAQFSSRSAKLFAAKMDSYFGKGSGKRKGGTQSHAPASRNSYSSLNGGQPSSMGQGASRGGNTGANNNTGSGFNQTNNGAFNSYKASGNDNTNTGNKNATYDVSNNKDVPADNEKTTAMFTYFNDRVQSNTKGDMEEYRSLSRDMLSYAREQYSKGEMGIEELREYEKFDKTVKFANNEQELTAAIDRNVSRQSEEASNTYNNDSILSSVKDTIISKGNTSDS